MNRFKKIITVIKKIMGYEEIFTVAYRDKRENEEYEIIKPNSKWWFADPIVFKWKAQEYLFCEMYDRKKLKGCIGVSKIIENKISMPQKIIEEAFHMSYPYVFAIEDKVFMLPETSASEALNFYEAIDFPREWKKVSTIPLKEKYVDTDVFFENGKIILLSSVLNPDNAFESKQVIDEAVYEDGKFQLCREKHYVMNDYNLCTRNAGRLVERKGKKLRPMQYSLNKVYGSQLAFSEWESERRGEEKIEKELLPENIKSKEQKKIIGVHTYGESELFEIIDIKILVFNSKKWINRMRKKYESFIYNK